MYVPTAPLSATNVQAALDQIAAGVIGLTGYQGITGASSIGSTGIQGVTGLRGLTGLNGQALPRVTGLTGAQWSVTPNSANTDELTLWGLTTGTTGISFVAPSGSPVEGQKLLIWMLDNGTATPITWSSSSGGYVPIGTALPTTTITSKYLYCLYMYNAVLGKWCLLSAVNQI